MCMKIVIVLYHLILAGPNFGVEIIFSVPTLDYGPIFNVKVEIIVSFMDVSSLQCPPLLSVTLANHGNF